MITLKDDIKDLAESMGAQEFHDLCNQCRKIVIGLPPKKIAITDERDHAIG